MRKNPKSFVPLLDNSIKNFESPRSARLKRFGRPDLITQEGVAAWHEAKKALIEQESLPELKWNDALALAA